MSLIFKYQVASPPARYQKITFHHTWFYSQNAFSISECGFVYTYTGQPSMHCTDKLLWLHIFPSKQYYTMLIIVGAWEEALLETVCPPCHFFKFMLVFIIMEGAFAHCFSLSKVKDLCFESTMTCLYSQSIGQKCLKMWSKKAQSHENCW